MRFMAEKLVVENLKIIYQENNKFLMAIKNLPFAVKENEFLCLLGPTGCGKTSVLNAIAGFIKPAKGRIMINGKNIEEPTGKIGIVFQNYALFPWKTVQENIGMGLKINGFSQYEISRLAKRYLQLIGLTKYSGYYPKELSGGMQQRVAIARVLANNPELILMDEPFASLDAQTRIKLQEQLLKIWQLRKKTIIFVTHDIDEAILLSDRILVMTKMPGKIKKEIKNNLPRPRYYKQTTDKKYIKLKRDILKLLE